MGLINNCFEDEVSGKGQHNNSIPSSTELHSDILRILVVSHN